MMVRLAVKPNGYNEVKGYTPVSQQGFQPTPAAPAAAPAPRSAPSASSAAPWKRSA